MASKETESLISEFLRNNRGATRQEVADYAGCSKTTVKRSESWKSAKTGEFDALDWLDWADEGRRLHERSIQCDKFLNWVSPLGDRPFGIVPMGDAHLMCNATDHSLFKRDYLWIRDDKDLFAFVLGDMMEMQLNGFPAAEPVHSQVASPLQQRNIFLSLMHALWNRNKLMACSDGNHGDHSTRHLGYNIESEALKRIGVPVFEGKGLTRVNAGEYSFYTLTQHQGGGRSGYSKTAACRKSYQNDFPATLVLSGHTHNFGINQDEHYPLAQEVGENFGGDRVEIVCGTYRVGANSFGAKIGGSGGRYACPVVIVIPEEKTIVPFKRLEHGRKFLKSL